jgi:Condensation domain
MTATSTALPIDAEDGAFELPTSFTQDQLWLAEQLTPGTALFNVPCLVRLEGPLDLAALEAALQSIVERHEILRTTFTTHDGQPLQLIHAHQPLP